MAGPPHNPRRQSHSYVNNRPTTALVNTRDGRQFIVPPGDQVSWTEVGGAQVGRPYTLDFRASRINQVRNPTPPGRTLQGGSSVWTSQGDGNWTRVGTTTTPWMLGLTADMIVIDESFRVSAEALDSLRGSIDRINQTAIRYRSTTGEWPWPPRSDTPAVPIPESSLSALAPTKPTLSRRAECVCGRHWDHRWEHSPDGCDWRDIPVSLVGYEAVDEDEDEDEDD